MQSLQYLQEAVERIELGAPVPARLTDLFASSVGAGGARPKASVRDGAGLLWLAKFASRGDRFDVARAEMTTLRLAAACGLSVPQTLPARPPFGAGRARQTCAHCHPSWCCTRPCPAPAPRPAASTACSSSAR